MWRSKVTWSSLEVDYLKANRDTQSIHQLSGYMGKSRTAIQNKLKEFDGKKVPGKKNKKSYIGKRPDIQGGLFVRSRWEAGILRMLQYEGVDFVYEPRVFVFEEIKHGTVSYLPDIYIPDWDQYIEIKGHLTSQGATAIRRFKKYYPEEWSKLRAVTGSANTAASKFFRSIGTPILWYYNDITKEYKSKIPEWE